MNTPTAPLTLTLGQAARRLGVELWQLQYLVKRGQGPTLGRVGPYRVVTEADLPALADAARAAGYLNSRTETGRPGLEASGGS